MSVPGGVLNERYELVEKIGGGSMGEVWRGRDLVLGRPVAVKIVLPMLLDVPTFRERFAAEARVMARIDHGGVADVYDYGVTRGPDGRETAFIIMEFVEGEPLDRVLARRGPLDPAAVLDVLGQLLDALAAVHRQGVVHRDIKPANVMVRAGRVVLADFGIARSPESSGLTADDTLLGTVPYLAPELFRNESITTAVDVYAVGILGYELLAGLPPFRADSTAAVMYMHVYEPPPPLPEHVPDAVVGLLERALEKNPEYRWPDAEAMASAVRSAIGADRFPEPGRGLDPEPEMRSRAGGPATRAGSGGASGLPPAPTVKITKPAAERNRRFLIPAGAAAAATLVAAVTAVVLSSGSGSAHQNGGGNGPGNVESSVGLSAGGLPTPSDGGETPSALLPSHRPHTGGTKTPAKSGTPSASGQTLVSGTAPATTGSATVTSGPATSASSTATTPPQTLTGTAPTSQPTGPPSGPSSAGN